ncbi:hypothetical protein [uncultured Sanguibacteroides sp.]|uniref:hypothetical protein n=1 Tax=uncultured Sanguibacteroides sp. TaxID=1635151 RepID=UPI0026009699|nr:hypothetical protein [uncultured Sanguibacteroides sp.]
MSNLFSLSELEKAKDPTPIDKSRAKSIRFEEAHLRRIENIKNLCGELPSGNEIFFLWACKSFNTFTFIPYVIKYSGLIEELCFSTYSINSRIVEALIRWYDKGVILSVTIYIADSIKYRMPDVVTLLEEQAKQRQIEIIYAWNHSKVQLLKSGVNYFVVEGSGNFSENAANEQYIFLNSRKVYEFRRDCFDGGKA